MRLPAEKMQSVKSSAGVQQNSAYNQPPADTYGHSEVNGLGHVGGRAEVNGSRQMAMVMEHQKQEKRSQVPDLLEVVNCCGLQPADMEMKEPNGRNHTLFYMYNCQRHGMECMNQIT